MDDRVTWDVTADLHLEGTELPVETNSCRTRVLFPETPGRGPIAEGPLAALPRPVMVFDERLIAYGRHLSDIGPLGRCLLLGRA